MVLFRELCNFHQYATDMINYMVANNSLTDRVNRRYQNWKEFTNDQFSDCPAFGKYLEKGTDSTYFQYLVDMITSDAINAGKHNEAMELVLQVQNFFHRTGYKCQK